MEVCVNCGAMRLAGAGLCEGCEVSASGVRAPDTDLMLVGVRASFQCRSCGHRSPLDDLDMDGSVQCQRCSQEQVFDVDQWTDALAFAHGVADLAGPKPEGRNPHPRYAIGRQNPHAQIGLNRVVASHVSTGQARQGGLVLPRSLELAVCPGHPLCAACHAPLVVQAASGGLETRGLDTHCPRCGDRARYGRPEQAPAGLVGVISELSRADRPEIASGETGLIGLRCPSCAAPLEIDGRQTLVTCRHCQLVSRVPARLRPALLPDRPPTQWWVAFRGSSRLRRALLGEGRDSLAEVNGSTLSEPPPRTETRLRLWTGRAARLAIVGAALGLSGLILLIAVTQGS